jgi:hypothetical protein
VSGDCQLYRRRLFIAPRPTSPRPIKPRVPGSGAGVAGISRSAYCGKLKLWTQPTRSASMSRLPPNMVRAIEPLLFIHPLGKMLPPPRPVRSREARLPRGILATDQNKSRTGQLAGSRPSCVQPWVPCRSACFWLNQGLLAGRVGFEPTVRLPVQRFSSSTILMLACAEQ